MVPGKSEYQNSYQGELGGQLGVMCAIQIIESIMGIAPLVVDSYDNISALRQSLIHPESVTSWWKQAVYHSIESGISLVHVYGHQNSGKSYSTLTMLSSLDVRLDALSEYIMASLLILPAPRTTIAVGFSDPYGLPSVSIRGVPVHSNIAQYIVYKISKHRILQYWVGWKITHMADWEGINLTPFEREWDRTIVHMSHFIMKCMSNTLSTMTILQQWGYASTNLYQRCGTVLETMHHMYQCIHEGSRGRWTASVEVLRKWLETRNIDPKISALFVDALLYIAGEVNFLPQCPKLALHSEILRIGWPSIILGLIPKSFACTQQNYFTHTGSKKTVLKWASQLITKIWKLVYRQWLHCSKFKHAGEVLDDNTKEIIHIAKITYEHGQVQDTLPQP